MKRTGKWEWNVRGKEEEKEGKETSNTFFREKSPHPSSETG
jgi:hypothetical protein